MSVLSTASELPVTLSGAILGGEGRALSLEGKDVHTWQEDDLSFEVGATRDCDKVLPVYLRTKQPTSYQLPVSLSPSYLYKLKLNFVVTNITQ